MGNEFATRFDDLHPSTWSPELVDLFRDERIKHVRIAYLLTGDQGVAEEVVQDAFIGLHTAGNRVRQPEAYLRTSVVNGCRSWLRHQRVVRLRPLDRPDVVLAEPDELWDALGRLDDRQRAAVVLRFYTDLPFAEIAELLGCRSVTVRTSVHRAVQQLGREIKR